MNHLLREVAPVSEVGWAAIDDEATRTLRHFLTARKVVDFSGPHGWTHAAEPTGRVEATKSAPATGVQAATRRVQPLTELRTPFEMSRRELEAVDRGAGDYDTQPVIDAARQAAMAEDAAVFHGYDPAGIKGISEASPHPSIDITDDYNEYPGTVARAVATLQAAGIGGPFAVALGPRCYTGVIETTERGGYPVLEHIRLIAGGPVLWAPSVDGAVVVSLRGGDFELTCGQDFSIGYLDHDADNVRLYLEESMTFRALSPDAGLALVYS
ncbi:MAG TPA: family 1 encapsulin nanocompartment shell protein [Acidimicrobiia bacterium]|nr:family 1 encapsulin nanocompartment shell protein [Acidimicrobiia bacterium]